MESRQTEVEEGRLVVYTIGHSNKSLEIFRTRLEQHGIQRLVDIRTRPCSRFCPWFNKNSLSQNLELHGIVYDFRGNNLGGLGENVDYDRTLDELIELAKTERIAIMCSEADFKKCHRHTMIEPGLAKRGIEVEHIAYV
jgi:uncharacterized protein (DUF488 family)